MKKIMIIVGLLVALTQVSLADFSNDYATATSLFKEGKFSEAATTYININTTYTNHLSVARGAVQGQIGTCYWRMADYVKAQEAFETAIQTYPTAPKARLAQYQFMVAECLNRRGRTDDGVAYVKASTFYGFVDLAFQKRCFAKIDSMKLGIAAYRAYLSNLLLIVPVNEENAEFLGQVKSKLDVIK